MTSLQEQFAELAAIAQLHLLQEFDRSERIAVNAESFAFFKQYALQQKPPQNAPARPSEPTAAPAALQPPKTAIITKAPPMPPVVSPEKPVAATPAPQPKMPLAEAVVPKKQEVKQPEKTASKTNFELAPLKEAAEISLGDIRDIIKEKFPKQALIDDVPSDIEAKKIIDAWKQEPAIPAIMVLSFDETAEQQDFLEKLSKAINEKIAPSAVVKFDRVIHEQGWAAALQTKELRFIIAPTHGLHASPELMKHYREAPKQAKHYLGNIPLFLLPDIGIYLKNPKLKISLWNDLKSMLN